jgi:hypothetical protein
MNIKYFFFQPLKNEILDKKNYLIQSIILHILIVYLCYYGLPNLFKYRSEFLPPLPIEIINISDKTAAPKINFKKDFVDDSKNIQSTEKSENQKFEEQSIDQEDDDAIALSKPKTKKVKKKTIIKIDKIKKKPNTLTSVFKSIEEVTKDFGEKKNKDKKKEVEVDKKKATPQKLGISLTISEEDAIRRHFEKCWNIPSGAREAGNLAAEIKVRFNKEGNVLDARILDINRMKRDRYFRTAAESALRAVLNPRCRNAPLPIDKYDKWKNITLNFDPKNVIGY